jgi:putative membrane protein
MMWGYYGTDPTWMGWSMALSALFWLALLGVAIWGIVRFTTRHASSTTQPSPLSAEEILRQRYARGEIDAMTYEAMRGHLAGGSRAMEPSAPRV